MQQFLTHEGIAVISANATSVIEIIDGRLMVCTDRIVEITGRVVECADRLAGSREDQPSELAPIPDCVMDRICALENAIDKLESAVHRLA